MPIFLSPSVVVREIDLSDVITNSSTARGAIVVRSKRGPLKVKFISNIKQYKELYCRNTFSLDKDVLEGYSAVAALEHRGSSVYVKRCVADGAKFSAVSIGASGGSFENAGKVDGLGLNLDKSGPASPTFAGDEVMLITASNPGVWGNNLLIKITDPDFTDKTFVVQVYEVIDKNTVPRTKQRVSRLKTAKDGYGRSLYIGDVFENHPYITVADNTSIIDTIMPKPQLTDLAFTGGSLGGSITNNDIGECWDLFKDAEQYDVSLLIQGGAGDETLQLKLTNIAENRKDCIALLDAPEDKITPQDLVEWRDMVLGVDSSYAALYAPWIYIYDWDNDAKRYIPPSGVVAGIIARNDYYHHAWFAPAGIDRGKVQVLGLSSYFNQSDRDLLSPKGINVFRRKPGQFALWDNKTLQVKDSALSFIEVRRLLIVLEKSIATMAESFLFQPLTEVTRQRFVATIEEYIRKIEVNQGLYPPTKIVCDTIGDPNGNNPPTNVDIGQLTCDIYLKPVHAIRYILLSAVVMRHGASFEEKVSLTV